MHVSSSQGILTVEALRKQFPDQWQAASKTADHLLQKNDLAALRSYVQQAQHIVLTWRRRARQGGKIPADVVKAKFTVAILEQRLKGALARSGGRTLSSTDLWLAQHLFFKRDLTRRVTWSWVFRLVWKVVKDKAAVMGQIQGKGIYCVFTKDYVRGVGKLISSVSAKSVLEVGAGDGTYSLALGDLGYQVHAVDDRSWSKQVNYPDWIEDLTAKAALQKYQPEVVICSWPPPENHFEEVIFKTPSVRLYIVNGSQNHEATGNRRAYLAAAAGFKMVNDAKLAKSLMPEELQNEVLVFSRQ